MDEVVRKALAEVQASARIGLPWKPDEPWHQAYHSYKDGRWNAIKPGQQRVPPSQATQSFNSIALYSWNIDFMLPYADSRMFLAISHLQKLITQQESNIATVVFLQECLKSDLTLLATHPWIQATFHLTDLDGSNWTSGHYGIVTLIDRRADLSACFRVHYAQTRMERDALFTDILLKPREETNDRNDGQAQILRLCNTHLESLALSPPLRPPQVALVASYLREPGLMGGITAGDFNAIQPFDRDLHSSNNLKDAYLELGGAEDSEEGFTWGQQAATTLREQFGCSRMDKVFFCGGVELRLSGFERFGAGVKLEDQREREEIVRLGFERPWVTDHLGVVARFDVVPKARAGETKI